jgi:putative transposase
MSVWACELHAFVLMTNHVHLLITPTTDNGLSKAMQSLGRVYVQQFNYRYGRTGTLWEGRYKATLVDSEDYVLACYRYIEMNPVRANMVEHPGEYPWSSYRSNALGDTRLFITPHEVYKALGMAEDTRLGAYRSLFEDDLSEQTITQIREMTNKAWVLGSSEFKKKIQALTDRPTGPKQKGGDRKSSAYKTANINRV